MMMLRDHTRESSPGVDPFRPRIFGDVKYKNVLLSRAQKNKIEEEAVEWILLHTASRPGEEVQYWVSFERLYADHLVSCRVEIFGESRLWEASETSPQPMQAFKKAFAQLTPALLSTA